MEIKNLNSFAAVQRAIQFEVERQSGALAAGEADVVVPETRVWDEAALVTRSMRRKEGMADYRFFPEPDLPPLVISEDTIDRIQARPGLKEWDILREEFREIGGRLCKKGRSSANGGSSMLTCRTPFPTRSPFLHPPTQASMPELPWEKRGRLEGLGLSAYDAAVLCDDVAVARYMDAVLAAGAPPKPAANWIMGDLMAHCKEAQVGMEDIKLSAESLAELIQLIQTGVISGKIGKAILPDLLQGLGADGVRKFVETQGLLQMSNVDDLLAVVDKVLADNPKQVEQYKSGACVCVGVCGGGGV